MASEFVKKFTVFISALFFILLYFIFCRFQLLQAIFCQWSRPQLNSSKKSYWNFLLEFPITKHLAFDIWDYKTFLVPLCMLNGLKKKHFRLDQNKWIVGKLIIDHGIYMFNYITGPIEEVRFIFFLLISLVVFGSIVHAQRPKEKAF